MPKNFIVFFSILLLLGLVYAPVFLVPFAHYDDYGYFAWDAQHPHFRESVDRGRYLMGPISSRYDLLVEKVEDLRKLRFLSLIYLSITAFVCYLWVRNYFHSWLSAFLFIVCIFTLPPFQIVMALGTGVLEMTAVFLSAAAASLLRLSELSKSGGFLKAVCVAGAIFLFVSSLMIYQPAAMFYWVMVALFSLPFVTGTDKALGKKIAQFGIIGVISMLIYAFIVSGISRLNNENSLLTTQYMLKLEWFFKDPLTSASNLWDIFPQLSRTYAVAGFILSAFVLYLFKEFAAKKKEKVFLLGVKVFLLLSLVFLSFSPNLLAKYNIGAYRCSLALTPIILLFVLLAVQTWLSLIPSSKRNSVLMIILLCACLWGMYKANTNVLNYRVIPSFKEFSYIKDVLARYDMSQYRRIVILRPNHFPLESQYRYDEFMIPTTYHFAFTPSIIKAALTELGIESVIFRDFRWVNQWILKSRVRVETGEISERYLTVLYTTEEAPTLLADGDLIVDMRKILL